MEKNCIVLVLKKEGGGKKKISKKHINDFCLFFLMLLCLFEMEKSDDKKVTETLKFNLDGVA